ncbi:hypothetical protein [Labrys wisconsinensis]|uniref:Ferrous iron transport protein A n=1 Tax=Labrys wisconsinensis TaxID=425677 RepID=A0ABU0JL43_9HYPH|nr:hypothetical protein [Labrys wisconsinensis]MDQ0475017.1 hypothetical protein [Labrys wisconsinensis]
MPVLVQQDCAGTRLAVAPVVGAVDLDWLARIGFNPGPCLRARRQVVYGDGPTGSLRVDVDEAGVLAAAGQRDGALDGLIGDHV